jgi:hypothetical protein
MYKSIEQIENNNLKRNTKNLQLFNLVLSSRVHRHKLSMLGKHPPSMILREILTLAVVEHQAGALSSRLARGEASVEA